MSPTLELEEPLIEILDTPDEASGLVTIKQARVSDLFEAPGLMQKLLDRIQEEANTFIPDTSTPKGRDLIASQAFRVSKTKTYLEGLGKAHVDDLKDRPKKVDATRKLMRDTLDALRDTQRQPLTVWETERDRQRAVVEEIRRRPTTLTNTPAEQISTAIENLEGEMCSLPGAAEAKAESLQTMRDILEKRRKWEADQAELERLRKDEQDRKDEAERDRLRKEGEETATRHLNFVLEAISTSASRQEVLAQVAGYLDPVTGRHHDLKGSAQAMAAFQSLPDCPPLPKEAATTLTLTQAPLPQELVGMTHKLQSGPQDPLPALDEDMEHRRTFDREALADIHAAIFQSMGQTALNIDPIANSVLTAIVAGKVRNISITY